MEIHPHSAGQIVSFELQPLQGSAGAELSKIPVGFLGAGHATASCSNQQGQPWSPALEEAGEILLQRAGQGVSWSNGKAEEMQERSFNLMELCPVESYKITEGFPFPGDFGGYQLCHHLQFLECGSLHQGVYFVQLETSSM